MTAPAYGRYCARTSGNCPKHPPNPAGSGPRTGSGAGTVQTILALRTVLQVSDKDRALAGWCGPVHDLFITDFWTRPWGPKGLRNHPHMVSHGPTAQAIPQAIQTSQAPPPALVARHRLEDGGFGGSSESQIKPHAVAVHHGTVGGHHSGGADHRVVFHLAARFQACRLARYVCATLVA